MCTQCVARLRGKAPEAIHWPPIVLFSLGESSTSRRQLIRRRSCSTYPPQLTSTASPERVTHHFCCLPADAFPYVQFKEKTVNIPLEPLKKATLELDLKSKGFAEKAVVRSQARAFVKNVSLLGNFMAVCLLAKLISFRVWVNLAHCCASTIELRDNLVHSRLLRFQISSTDGSRL